MPVAERLPFAIVQEFGGANQTKHVGAVQDGCVPKLEALPGKYCKCMCCPAVHAVEPHACGGGSSSGAYMRHAEEERVAVASTAAGWLGLVLR